MNTLIVGANRGIGLALVQNLLADEAVMQVLATCRSGSDRQDLLQLQRDYSGKLQLLSLDFTDQQSLAHFAANLAALGCGIDLVIHAAGLLHAAGLEPEKSLEQCQSQHLLRLFEVNSIGPLLVAQTLLATQQRNKPFVFAALSAMVGSIGDNKLGGWYGYRASKAALNQFIKTLSIECRTRYPQAAIVAIHPGTTDTGLSRPFQRNIQPGKLYTPEESAARILQVLAHVGSQDSGKFYNWDGKEICW
ncbi:MAG: SDR family NAD(P)-dependent oxidoreductase [Xanthomonadales bacterium]|nr:SDR family NAD(P)-dependent oxidoreductase [Xanthomonadales bacterium]